MLATEDVSRQLGLEELPAAEQTQRAQRRLFAAGHIVLDDEMFTCSDGRSDASTKWGGEKKIAQRWKWEEQQPPGTSSFASLLTEQRELLVALEPAERFAPRDCREDRERRKKNNNQVIICNSCAEFFRWNRAV